jgi:hypothetical protein
MVGPLDRMLRLAPGMSPFARREEARSARAGSIRECGHDVRKLGGVVEAHVADSHRD